LKNCFDLFIKVAREESGYYYAEYENGRDGKRITIGETTLIIFILCITLLCLTVLVLSFKAGMLSKGITFFLILIILVFLSAIVIFAKTKTHAVNINVLLILMAILCFLILGLNVQDIKDLLGSLFRKRF